MNQTLKISIVRGGCRFATPLYLGASYVLSFEGQRADEAATVLFVKPTSKTPEKTTGIEGLAQSVTDAGTGAITLALNKTVLVDWFTDNRACDVDACVDAHCYVFNSAGEVIADSPVTIEYRPVDFVVDETGFSQYTQLLTRIVALEENRTLDVGRIAQNEADIAALEEEDDDIRADMAEAIADACNTTLGQARTYADMLRSMVSKMMYVRDASASDDAGVDLFRKIEVRTKVVGSSTELVLSLSSDLVALDGGDPDSNKYVYNDRNNTFSGTGGITNTFNSIVVLNGVTTLTATPSTSDNSKKVVNSEWVCNKLDAWLAISHTWTAKQTFSAGVDGDVTGGVSVPAAKTLAVSGSETHGGTEAHTGTETHSGEETHSGTESHSGNEAHTGEVAIIGDNNLIRKVSQDSDSDGVEIATNLILAKDVNGKAVASLSVNRSPVSNASNIGLGVIKRISGVEHQMSIGISIQADGTKSAFLTSDVPSFALRDTTVATMSAIYNVLSRSRRVATIAPNSGSWTKVASLIPGATYGVCVRALSYAYDQTLSAYANNNNSGAADAGCTWTGTIGAYHAFDAHLFNVQANSAGEAYVYAECSPYPPPSYPFLRTVTFDLWLVG